MKKSCLKHAFTLAEVLITLGIIGVVAAITMPTLIQNYKKQVYVNQLKKACSTLEQGFQKMLADEGVERLSDLPDVKSSYYPSKEGVNDFINDFLSKGFHVTYKHLPNYKGISDNAYSEDGYSHHAQFNDGIAIVRFDKSDVYYRSSAECDNIKSKGGTMCSMFGEIDIDINGEKAPNEAGRDIFYFWISDEGKLYPFGGKDHALFSSPTTALESNDHYWKNPSGYYGCGGNSRNYGCIARIIENGWKMDY